jgi:hypothetical protein
MVTTYALYVPDWTFVLHKDHGAKRYIVCGRYHLNILICAVVVTLKISLRFFFFFFS